MNEQSRHPSGFDADETAALAELGWAPPSAPTRCPDPSLLLAVDAAVLDDLTIQRVRAHVRDCATCRRLAFDLAVVLDVDPDEVERARIRARVLATPRRGGRAWRAVGAAALAAAATIAFVVVRSGGPLTLPATPASPVTQLRTQPPTVFTADRPRIARPEPEFTLRGNLASLPVAERIGRALDAADTGSLHEAERELRAITGADGAPADAHLALGAVLVRDGRPAEAVAVLERGRTRASSRSAEEFDWYLAVALARSGSTTRASAALAALCRNGSLRGALACAGLAELDRGARR